MKNLPLQLLLTVTRVTQALQMDIGALPALTEPSDWNFKPLEELDQLLRCPICFEYYKTAMMFPQCSHNFCSLCIRRYLSATNSKCPMCTVSVIEGDLKNNRLLDQFIDQFTKNRRALLSLVQSVERRGEGRTEESNLDDDTSDGRGSVPVRERRDESSTYSPVHGRSRQFVVPEAPNLPDSEAFIGNILSGNDRVIPSNTHIQHEEVGGGGREREGREVSDGSSNAEESKSLSVSLPWRQEDDLVWEGGRERPRLFGDLGGGESGEKGEAGEGVGMCKWEEGTKKRSYSASTPSRPPSTHHSSTASPLPPPPPSHSSPHPTSTSTTSLNHAQSASISPVTVEDSPSANKVECPVCGLLVPSRFINRHLDNVCLKQLQVPITKDTARPRYSKVPKLVYQLMKDKQLKLKLKEYHLPTQGDRQALISRLKEFILRFNSQCDSLTPRPPKEVAMEIEKEEKLREAHKQTHSPVVRTKKESNAEELERQQREYEETHKDQFSKLVARAREGTGSERGCSLDLERLTPTDLAAETSDSGDQQESPSHVSSCRLVLAGASPDNDHTPPLQRGPASTSRAAVTIPESPCLGASHTRQHRLKRRRLLTPPNDSPPSSLPTAASGEDPEFVPTTSHYRTPLTSHTTRASKRQRR